jgi:hypothetical protein
MFMRRRPLPPAGMPAGTAHAAPPRAAAAAAARGDLGVQ